MTLPIRHPGESYARICNTPTPVLRTDPPQRGEGEFKNLIGAKALIQANKFVREVAPR
jgi:hypothetical protein